ncbi:retrotransposon protein, putative, ty1-copia subclass [Tanacetum coccineum]
MAARGQNQRNGKNKHAYAPKPKIPPPPKREDPAKDSICHECGETGHWKRNCPQYLAELLKKKKNVAFGAGLRASRKLKPGALSLYVGNGQREAVEAIGNFDLSLPSGLVIVLNNCHYAPSITRGVILVSRLYEDGFINLFVNNTIQVSKNNMVYFSVIPKDGIFEIELSNSYVNESSIYTVSNKRSKLDLDSALLWHCRLGHISKKRIEKLQHDGFLNSTDLRDFEKYVPCMSGKMARKPCTHQVERAKDLLGLIHTDCLKPKVFKKEVENQLGKTIKSLRSDRGGEYMSQEFLDHLKDHGIIAHRTPPYTPQHFGCRRENRTLLDMVRSMMSQTTLPKSFWDYALETAACILNMVPTKKVEKTPYEVWHGQAPKLSYLKVWGCEALVKRDTLTKPDKLEPRSIKCIFIGYPKETMGYSFYYPPENKVLVARNAEFLENSLINQEASGSLEDLEIIQEEGYAPLLHKLTIMNKSKAAYILGIKIYRDRSRRLIGLCQSAYIEKILKRFHMENSKRGSIPMQDKLRLSKSQGASTPAELKRMQSVPYASAVGSIMYAVIFTGLLLRHSEVTPGMQRTCFSLRSESKTRAQTGYVFVLNGGVVDWKSAKQSIFATSSAEAEYIAAFDASKEAGYKKKGSREDVPIFNVLSENGRYQEIRKGLKES